MRIQKTYNLGLNLGSHVIGGFFMRFNARWLGTWEMVTGEYQNLHFFGLNLGKTVVFPILFAVFLLFSSPRLVKSANTKTTNDQGHL